MNVWQRHCVFFSFAPVGPIGRGHIQKDRPLFMPLFFVRRLMHGSLCPSHLGAAGFVKSFVQDSLLSIGSCTVFSVNVLAPPVNGDASEDSKPSIWYLIEGAQTTPCVELVATHVWLPKLVVGLPSTKLRTGTRIWCGVSSSERKGVVCCSDTLPPVFGLGVAFEVKKPRKLCCPLTAVERGFDATPGFMRLGVLLGATSVEDRFRFGDGNGLAGVVAPSELGERAALAVGVESLVTVPSLFFADGASSNPDFKTIALCNSGTEGLRANISPMFLRPSNSGISFPDNGNKSFLAWSR